MFTLNPTTQSFHVSELRDYCPTSDSGTRHWRKYHKRQLSRLARRETPFFIAESMESDLLPGEFGPFDEPDPMRPEVIELIEFFDDLPLGHPLRDMYGFLLIDEMASAA